MRVLVFAVVAVAACNHASELPRGAALDGALAAAADLGAAGVQSDLAATPAYLDLATPVDVMCSYIDTQSYIVWCGGQRTTFYQLESFPAQSGCPIKFQVSGQVFDSLTSLFAQASCDASCVYRPATSALFIYCGAKAESTSFADGAPGQTAAAGSCPALYNFTSSVGGGWYASRDEFEAAHPCP